MEAEERATRLIRIIRDSDSVYEPQYIRKCADELSAMADSYPEAYSHLSIYYTEHGEDVKAEYFCKKGANAGEPCCLALEVIWKYYDSVADDTLRNVEALTGKSVLYVHRTLAEHYENDGNKEESIRQLCLAYDAYYPKYKTKSELRELQLYAKYDSNDNLFEKYASERLMNVLRASDMYFDTQHISDDVPEDVIYDTYIITGNVGFLRILMKERKYKPAFEEAYYFHWDNWKTDNNKKILDNAIEFGIPEFMVYAVTYEDWLKMAEEGNIFAMNEIASCHKSGLCGEYSPDIAYKYAMAMADSGLNCLHWSITATLWFLYESGRKEVFDNDYIKDTYKFRE